MPSMRRMRIFVVVLFSAVFYILYLTSQARMARSPGFFYSKTQQALNKEKGPLLHPHTPSNSIGVVRDDDDAIQQQLAAKAQEAERVAIDPPRPFIEDVRPDKDDVEKNVRGKNKHDSDEKLEKVIEKGDDAESREVEQELKSILKRSPIIIFSKTYCPHSKKAKKILLEKYTIIPAPYVVELDEHPLGPQIQAKLGETTGRRTVPNILINNESIGGGDDIVDLDDRMALASKIKTIGGKQIQDVKEMHT